MAHSHHDHSHEHVRRLSSLNRAFIAGILLNDCSAMLARSLAPMLGQETGVPVLGYLPHMPEAAFGGRHLGLYTAAEIDDKNGIIKITLPYARTSTSRRRRSKPAAAAR